MAEEFTKVDIRLKNIDNNGCVFSKPFVPGKNTCCSYFPSTFAYKHVTMNDFDNGIWYKEEDVIDEYAED